MSQLFCVMDYETRSEADLKKVGAWEYSVHPSTRILCASWAVGTLDELRDNPVVTSWSPALPELQQNFGDLLRSLRTQDQTLTAHNAYFEQVITKNVLAPRYMASKPELREIPIERWTCTAALAASCGIPRHLDGACAALRLKVQKDLEGKKLMLKYCKPRKPTKNNPAKWHNSVADLMRIIEYCETDVRAEIELLLRLYPKHALSPHERRVWVLNQEVNHRGFRVDRPLVKTVLKMIDQETARLNDETMETTGLLSTNQRDAMLAWLEKEGVFLPDLKAKTVSDALKGGMAEGAALSMLKIRQAVSKTSTAKYTAFDLRSAWDGRCRDILVYHAAHTGREGGSGVQPQNFPRGTIADTDEACEILKDGDLEWVRFLYGDPMSVFSSCLRGMIIPSEGKEFVGADFAAIEARVLFWIADHQVGLQMYREEQDLYRDMAADIVGVPEPQVTKKQRDDLGKSAILGCGFGMGWKKFLASCREKGIEVSEELAKIAVAKYREKHAPVPELWRNLERAAVKAVLAWKRGERKIYSVNRTQWWVDDGFLVCRLPSGRCLHYYGPAIKYEETPWGEPRPVLYHWGINSRTKQWELGGTYGGKLTENVVQATARDLMVDAQLRIDEDPRYDLVLSVHDELLAEQDAGRGEVWDFEALMAAVPAWARGCPVKAEGWIGMRYKK